MEPDCTLCQRDALNEQKGFIDPSIAAAALELSPDRVLDDLNTFGFLFESLCIRDLSIYSSELGGSVAYYHDRYGLECDIVLHLNNGNFALIEAKLGSQEIEEGAGHLCRLRDLLAKNQLDAPSFLMVLTGGQYAYKRPDDVYVIPIACLKP